MSLRIFVSDLLCNLSLVYLRIPFYIAVLWMFSAFVVSLAHGINE
jgi:phosphate/sulfate permease